MDAWAQGQKVLGTLLSSGGSLDKGSEVENAFFDPLSGMRGVRVKNLIETLFTSEGSLNTGSKLKLHSRPLIRDAWGQDQKPHRNVAQKRRFA